MSDYLSRIVERVKPAREALQPALPSLFEPTTTESTARLHGDYPEPPPEPEFAPRMDDRRREARHSDSPRSPVTTLEIETVSPSPKFATQMGDRRAAAHQLDTPRSAATALDIEGARPVPKSAPPIAEKAQPTAPAPEALRHAKETIAPPQKAPPFKPERVLTTERSDMPHANSSEKSVPLREPDPPAQRTMSPARIEHHSIVHETLALPRELLAALKTAGRIEGATRQTIGASGNGEPQFSGPPDIRVTIGRVEVRAIKPSPVAAPVQNVPRREPGLSLDDYLRSRKGAAA